MKKSSLRLKTALFLSLLSAILFSGIYLYIAKEISSGFITIEDKDVITNLGRSNDSILELAKNGINKLGDWGQWDDAYKYIQDKNKAFEKSNLQANMVTLKFDIYSFWTSDKKLVWSSNFNLDTEDDAKKMYPVIKADLDKLKQIEKLHLTKDFQDKKFVFAELSEGPYILVSVPIVSTDGKSPVKGSIIAGIKLDKETFDNLGKKLHLAINTLKKSELKLNFENNLAIIKNIKEIEVYQIIKNYADEDMLVYNIKIPRDIYLQSQITLKTILICMIIAWIGLVILMLGALELIVLSSLLKLDKAVKVICETGNLKQRVPDLGRDEIGELGHLFNETLSEMERLRAASFHNEKLAALGEMAGGIAHEINNPIAIIGASSNIIQKLVNKGVTDPEKYLKCTQEIDKTIIRITKIIVGLKNVSRDTSNEDFSKCSIGEILNETLAICTEKFTYYGVQIIYNQNDPVFKTELPCLRVQLSQVFFNLLGNSLDAIEKLPSPWVKITASIEGENLVIKLTDAGSGIPLEIQDKILQPFFTTKEIGKGTGLGLSLSNAIIGKHNGTFTIDNNCPNTCFVISLPLK